ncbi:protein tramtrack, alpha isoform isoform X1 [Hyalella azteca]|uniref:Protein tramtrack, alpha isoform isoform X1 n=1 Tax=Hyalella azteca TaxID=294128 RepID=A0A8B7NFX1_HYAAZ|nr:protein tramtrack, alpha isoform isoform X1 [Hyalella azteca]
MEELLSLKWNNHRSTFLHILAVLRDKQLYTDATLACDGKLYSVHKLVLSTCSDYFSSMLDRTSCKSPVIVLKDIKSDDLEALLDYMYLGEVNVRQSDLSTLIKAAECLRVKGLAVADDEPPPPRKSSKSDYSSRRSESTSSPPAKRKRRGDAIEDGRDDVRPTRTDNRRVSPSTSRPKSPPSTTFTSPTNPLKANSSSANARNSVDDPSVAKSSNSNDDYVDLAPCIKVEMTEDSDRPPDDDSNMDGNTGDMGEGLPDSYGVDSENFKEEDDPDDGDLNSDLPEFLQQATAGYQHSSFGGPSFPSDLSWQGNEDNGGSGSGYGAAASSAQYPAHDAAQSSAGIMNSITGAVREPHFCPTCGKAFNGRNWKQNLEYHMFKHTGLKPFQCPFCRHSSALKFNLLRHIKNKHSDAMSQPLLPSTRDGSISSLNFLDVAEQSFESWSQRLLNSSNTLASVSGLNNPDLRYSSTTSVSSSVTAKYSIDQSPSSVEVVKSSPHRVTPAWQHGQSTSFLSEIPACTSSPLKQSASPCTVSATDRSSVGENQAFVAAGGQETSQLGNVAQFSTNGGVEEKNETFSFLDDGSTS